MLVVLLTQSDRHPYLDQAIVSVLMITVVVVAYILMRFASPISRMMGSAGASVVSRIMGMILASVAATQVLEGLKSYFS